MSLETGVNWAGNLRYGASGIVAPRTTDEVRDAVTGAGAVRAVGTRHSFNAIADTDGLLVSTENLVDAPVIDADAGTVTVGAGIRYGELGRALQARGLALSNLASLPHISVGGAIATGTHGSGDAVASLAAVVAGLEIVTASGDVLTLSRGDADFDGAVVSLGALGIVTRVTLDVEQSFDVAQNVYERLAVDAVLDDVDAVTGAAYSVSMFTTWRDPDVLDQLWLKRRPDAGSAAPDEFLGARAATEARHPLPGISAENCTQQLGVAGPWIDRLPHFRLEFTPSNGEELQSEYLVPRRNAAAALEAVRGLSGRIAPLLQVNEIRTVAEDGLWLSSSYGEGAVGFHFTWLPRQAEVEAVLPAIEEALLPLGARPHWGKLFSADASTLRGLYPRFDDFVALAGRHDPRGVFRNAWLERTVFPA